MTAPAGGQEPEPRRKGVVVDLLVTVEINVPADLDVSDQSTWAVIEGLAASAVADVQVLASTVAEVHESE